MYTHTYIVIVYIYDSIPFWSSYVTLPCHVFFDILLRPGMHGGISPSLDSLDNIRQLDRIQEAGMKTTKISAVDGWNPLTCHVNVMQMSCIQKTHRFMRCWTNAAETCVSIETIQWRCSSSTWHSQRLAPGPSWGSNASQLQWDGLDGRSLSPYHLELLNAIETSIFWVYPTVPNGATHPATEVWLALVRSRWPLWMGHFP